MRAREADPLSAFGGIVGLNRPIDVDTARALTSTFIEAVVAPAIAHADEVLPILAAKPNLRVVTASFDGLERRRATCGRFSARWLVQARDRVVEARRAWPGHGAGEGRDPARADGRRVEGAAVCLARLRAREVEHGHLHRTRRRRWRSAPGR